MSIEVRWSRVAALVCLAAIGFSLGTKAQGGPLYGAVGRSLEAVPMSVAPEKAGTLAPEDLLLWKEGLAFAELPKGRPFPKDLPPGVPVEVTVAGLKEGAIAGLDLEYRPIDWPNLPAPFGRVQTDGRGRARLFLPKGRAVLLWIADPAYLPKPILVDGLSSRVELEAEPSPPGSLRVEGPYQRALGGASALFLAASAPRNPLRLVRERASAARRLKADAQGFLALEANVMAGGILVWAKGFSLKEIPPRAGQVRTALAPATPVRLCVKKPEGLGSGWTAEVRHSHLDLPWLSTMESWHFPCERGTVFPSGFPCKIAVSAERCATEERVLKGPPSNEVALSLPAAVTLAGRVVDEQGQSAQEATVFLGALGGRPYVRTDALGRFALPPQPVSDAPWDLVAQADNHVTSELRGVTTDRAGQCTIILSRGAGIVGRVEAPTGDGLPAHLRVRVKALAGVSSQGAAFDAHVAQDGSFSVNGLEEGRYRVEASSKGLRSAPVFAEVPVAGTADAGTLLLDSRPAVSGLLRKKGGDIVDARDAEIRLVRSMGPAEMASEAVPVLEADQRGEDGSFSFWGVPAGTYRVEARHAGFSGRSEKIVVTQEDVDAGELTLHKEVTLRGRLASRRERNWSGYRVLLQTGVLDYDGPAATADADGQFSLGPVAPGRYTMAVFEPFAIVPRLRRLLEVDAADEGRELRVFLDGVDLTVLARLDGRPAVDANLSWEAAHEEPEGAPLAINTPDGMLVVGFPAPFASARTDGGGFAFLSPCSAGPGTAVLSWNGGRWSLPVFVPENPKQPEVWDFASLSLSGRVESGQGDAVPGILVRWEYVGCSTLPDGAVRTDGQGGFTLSGLFPAVVRLLASDPEKGEAEAQVDLSVPAGGVALWFFGWLGEGLSHKPGGCAGR